MLGIEPHQLSLAKTVGSETLSTHPSVIRLDIFILSLAAYLKYKPNLRNFIKLSVIQANDYLRHIEEKAGFLAVDY